MSQPQNAVWSLPALLLMALFACTETSTTPEEGASAPEGTGSQGAPPAEGATDPDRTSDTGEGDPPVAATATLGFRFEPPFAEATDVAVAEKLHYRVRLVPVGEGEVPAASLVSGCDCLSAEFATPLTKDGAEVDVYVEGHQVEDIEGVLWLEGPNRQQIAEHNVKILIQFKPFVSPREVVLTEASRTFDIGVYLATPPGGSEGEFIFEDAPQDGAPYSLIDYQTVEDLTVDFLLRGHVLTFEVPQDHEGPIDHRQVMKMSEPAVTFEVPVRRE